MSGESRFSGGEPYADLRERIGGVLHLQFVDTSVYLKLDARIDGMTIMPSRNGAGAKDK
jgi:hypothetical protein